VATLVDDFHRQCAESGIEYLDLDDERRGIVHVVGPEQAFTQPGMVVVCPDSHTSTHGALGALAFGIGVSQLEHVLATQTILQRPAPTMRLVLQGRLADPVSAKDAILAVIRAIGVDGAAGHALEFAGPMIDQLGVPGRLTVCNMAIEAGARYALIAPDETIVDWLRDAPRAPRGAEWDQALSYWHSLRSDDDAVFDRDVTLDLGDLEPQVSWGTAPDMVVGVGERVPGPDTAPTPDKTLAWRRALDYMGLEAGTPVTEIAVDRVFIGSCTNSRLDDLRAAADIVRGRRVSDRVQAIVVPGSGLVKKAAQEHGLHRTFLEAGFEWRSPGCSLCFGGPNESVGPGQRCASTSNRNFENRQGKGARTHLVSPATAAAAALTGRFVDVRRLVR
jgi:3-isopropylmalate/(R)-2-methylmalate dehydratase large subunit